MKTWSTEVSRAVKQASVMITNSSLKQIQGLFDGVDIWDKAVLGV